MKTKDNRLFPPSSLISLERGKEEMLLVNAAHFAPLYVQSGRTYIKKILAAAAEGIARRRLSRLFPQDRRLLRAMIDHKILVPEEGEEESAPTTEELLCGPRPGITLYLLLSQSCNLRCLYCFNGARSYREKKRRRMNAATARQAVEKCFSLLSPRGRLQIAFFGGEPLLNWPVIKETITFCEQVRKTAFPHGRLLYHITTNLTLFPSDLVSWAKEHHLTFLVDVDGPAKLHDQLRPYLNGRASHERIAVNIRRLRREGIPVYLRSTVCVVNEAHLASVVSHHHELGGVSTALVPLSPINTDEEFLPQELLPSPGRLLRFLEKVSHLGPWAWDQIFPFTTYSGRLRPGTRMAVGCGAPLGNTFAVTAEGEMFPCSSLVGIERFSLGNVFEPGAPRRAVLKTMMDRLHVDSHPECRPCAWRYLCGGGCPVWRLLVLDNPRSPAKIRNYVRAINCRFTQKVLEILFWEMAGEAAAQMKEAASRPGEETLDPTIFC